MKVKNVLCRISPTAKEPLGGSVIYDFVFMVGIMVRNMEMDLTDDHQSALHSLIKSYLTDKPHATRAENLTQACIIATWINSVGREPPKLI